MKIYIAGKYTGLGHEAAEAKFNRSEEQLLAAGASPHEVVNPIKHVPRGTPWNEAMKICMPLIPACTAIFFQADYRTSPGSLIEMQIAKRHGLDIIYEHEGGIEEVRNLINCGIL